MEVNKKINHKIQNNQLLQVSKTTMVENKHQTHKQITDKIKTITKTDQTTIQQTMEVHQTKQQVMYQIKSM